MTATDAFYSKRDRSSLSPTLDTACFLVAEGKAERFSLILPSSASSGKRPLSFFDRRILLKTS